MLFHCLKPHTDQTSFEHRSTHSILFNTEKLLAIIEPTAQSDEVEIDPEKLKVFNSRIKVWDFGKISSSEFQSLSFDNKSNLLEKYYVEMLAKYTVGKGKLFFCSCLAIFWLCFDCKVWLCLAFLWLCFE